MDYVIQLLKDRLRAEKGYMYQHKKLINDRIKLSDKRVYEYSVRLAEKRIPELEKSINILTKQ